MSSTEETSQFEISLLNFTAPGDFVVDGGCGVLLLVDRHKMIYDVLIRVAPQIIYDM